MTTSLNQITLSNPKTLVVKVWRPAPYLITLLLPKKYLFQNTTLNTLYKPVSKSLLTIPIVILYQFFQKTFGQIKIQQSNQSSTNRLNISTYKLL